MTREETIAKIEEKEEELKQVKGTECEVFSRIVGYITSTRYWHKGKQEEFKDRKIYKV